MAEKTETLYNALLPFEIVTFDDIVQQASKIKKGTPSRGYIYHKIYRLIKAGRLKAIRRGLYIVLSPFEYIKEYEPDKLLVASKIRKEYYLGFHTALEYYGSAYSAFNQAYICIKPKNRFDPFNYKRFTFKPVFVKDTFSEVFEKPYRKSVIKVSSKERTFIECVDRPQYSGGWEECLKSLENLNGVDVEKLINLTLKQERRSLVKRIGYVLELLKNRSPFYEDIKDILFKKIEAKINAEPEYLVRGEKGSLNRRWNLYIPEGFEEELIGV